jgi:hypothetical protein
MINEMKENMCKKMNKFKEMKEHDIKRWMNSKKIPTAEWN